MPGEFHNILTFLTIAEIAQAALLIFILLVMKRNRKANIFLAAFFLLFSMNFLAGYLHGSGYMMSATVISVISLPGISILGALMFFYTSLITGQMNRFKLRNLFHFAIYPIYALVFGLTIYIYRGMPDPRIYIKGVVFFVMGSGLLISLMYVGWSFVRLKKYSSMAVEYFSDYERHNMNWIKRLVVFSFIALFVMNSEFWLSYFHIIERSPFKIISILVILICIIFFIAYYLINMPEIFRENLEMNRVLDEETKEPEEKEKYARQSIDDEMQKEYLDKLNKYMEDEKPYLSENLSIKDLSESIQIPSHHLSIVINNLLGINFYTFINNYRVKEAVRILENPENCDASIISIAFSSGFNSKSTFNTVFKKNTGKTPSQYRDEAVLKSRLAS